MGYLGFAVSVAVFFLLSGTRSHYRLVPFLLILFGLAIAYVPMGDFTPRFEDVESDFKSDRGIQYRLGFDLFVQNPVVGAGNEAFAMDMAREGMPPLQPHSNLLSVLTNSGLMGFCPFLFFFLGYVRWLFHHWGKVKDRTLKIYAAGGVAAVAGLHAQGLFIGNMGWFLLWAITGIPICSLLARGDPKPNAESTDCATHELWRKKDCLSEVSVL